MAQNGFLLVLMQPPENIEEEFNAWYDTEHVPERRAVPGVLTAIRFASVSAATPKYLAMYDLESESVLDSEAYKRVAGANSSPWTRRVTGKTKVYRSVGNQIYPGNAITLRSARVTLLRFRGLEASASDSVVSSLRAVFEGRASTLQLRVFAYHVGGKVDFIGFVSWSVPETTDVDPKLLGAHARAGPVQHLRAALTELTHPETKHAPRRRRDSQAPDTLAGRRGWTNYWPYALRMVRGVCRVQVI